MLIHGDCLDVLPTLPDASVDMVFADLPYGVTDARWDAQLPLDVLWAHLLCVTKPNGCFIFTATQPFVTTLIGSQKKLFRYDMVWKKSNPTGFLLAKKQPLRNFEMMIVFYRQQPTYNPQMTFGHPPYKKTATATTAGTLLSKSRLRTQKVVNDGSRYPTAVQEFDCSDLRGAWGNSKRKHPTQKPVALLEWLIRTYTNEGDTVLDPTCGSGTTAIAAINTNRRWVCIEKDAGYHATAAKRIAEHQAAPKQSTLAV